MTPDDKAQILMEHPDESPEIVGTLPSVSYTHLTLPTSDLV